jgi:hypothetical protein
MDLLAALIFFADGATAGAAAFNAAWLCGRWLGAAAPVRRLATATLALVNAGIAAQAAFAQATFTAHRLGWPLDPWFETAPWLAARAPLLAGTLLLSLLILRRAR